MELQHHKKCFVLLTNRLPIVLLLLAAFIIASGCSFDDDRVLFGNPDLAASAAGYEAEPVQRDGFTDYPVVIGESTDFPLKGLLSMPDSREGLVPAAVIVHGSGASNMDGAFFGNTPYRDIAEYLAANGIAVIRYDKRTYTHGEEMVRVYCGSLTVWEESIEDAILAADILRADPRIDENRIFVIGHSLGGMLAPRIHASGGNFSGLILLAASPRDLTDIIIEQFRASIYHGMPDMGEVVIGRDVAGDMLEDIDMLEEEFNSIRHMSADEAKTTYISLLDVYAYYFWDMLAHPFYEYVDKVDAPILVMQGGRDFQVLANVDFALLQELLAGRGNVDFRLYEGLDHRFMKSTATNFVEHATEITRSPGVVDALVLRDIADWIQNSS